MKGVETRIKKLESAAESSAGDYRKAAEFRERLAKALERVGKHQRAKEIRESPLVINNRSEGLEDWAAVLNRAIEQKKREFKEQQSRTEGAGK
jgi:hypothetical protein